MSALLSDAAVCSANSFIRAVALLLLTIGAMSTTAVNVAGAEQNERFPSSDVLSKRTISQTECEGKRQAVWVKAEWLEKGLFGESKEQASGCIRYFVSRSVEGAKSALFFLHGDVDAIRSSQGAREEYDRRANFDDLQNVAEQASSQAGVPVVWIGRPGVYGSTGMNHITDRRTPIEAHLVGAAVDAIKAKLGFERISIAGQSGGGGIVGALLTLGRRDFDCAVIASGVVSVRTRLRMHPRAPSNGTDIGTGRSLGDLYDPIVYISKVASDTNRRVLVVGDPRDTSVAFASQKEFHDKLAQSGHRSILLEANGTGSDFHGLTAVAYRLGGWCHRGEPDETIRTRLAN